jgi:hypothetical protein
MKEPITIACHISNLIPLKLLKEIRTITRARDSTGTNSRRNILKFQKYKTKETKNEKNKILAIKISKYQV